MVVSATLVGCAQGIISTPRRLHQSCSGPVVQNHARPVAEQRTMGSDAAEQHAPQRATPTPPCCLGVPSKTRVRLIPCQAGRHARLVSDQGARTHLFAAEPKRCASAARPTRWSQGSPPSASAAGARQPGKCCQKTSHGVSWRLHGTTRGGHIAEGVHGHRSWRAPVCWGPSSAAAHQDVAQKPMQARACTRRQALMHAATSGLSHRHRAPARASSRGRTVREGVRSLGAAAIRGPRAKSRARAHTTAASTAARCAPCAIPRVFPTEESSKTEQNSGGGLAAPQRSSSSHTP